MGLFSRGVDLDPQLARFADGKAADARELARVQESLFDKLDPNEIRDICYIVTALDGFDPVLVVMSTRLLVGSAKTGTMHFSVPKERIGSTSVYRLASGAIRLKISLIRPAIDLSDGSEGYDGDFYFVRSNTEALLAVAYGIDKIFGLEEPAVPAEQAPTRDTERINNEAWFISWVNGIQSSMTRAEFEAAMGKQDLLDAMTACLTKACEEVYITCFGMIKANCPPESLDSFKAHVEANWVNVSPWGLMDTAADLDPTNGIARGEWEAAIHEVVWNELDKLRQSIVGSC